MNRKKIGTVRLMQMVAQFELLDGIDCSYEYMSNLGIMITNAYDALSEWQKKHLGVKCEEVESVIMTSKTVYNALKFEA